MYDSYLHLPNMDVTNKEEIDQSLTLVNGCTFHMQGTDKKGSKQKIARKHNFYRVFGAT